MLRKPSAQEALLLSPEHSGGNSSSYQHSSEFNTDESFVEMRFTATCEGALGTAKIYNDGSFTFKSHTVGMLQFVLGTSAHRSLVSSVLPRQLCNACLPACRSLPHNRSYYSIAASRAKALTWRSVLHEVPPVYTCLCAAFAMA